MDGLAFPGGVREGGVSLFLQRWEPRPGLRAQGLSGGGEGSTGEMRPVASLLKGHGKSR